MASVHNGDWWTRQVPVVSFRGINKTAKTSHLLLDADVDTLGCAESYMQRSLQFNYALILKCILYLDELGRTTQHGKLRSSYDERTVMHVFLRN